MQPDGVNGRRFCRAGKSRVLRHPLGLQPQKRKGAQVRGEGLHARVCACVDMQNVSFWKYHSRPLMLHRALVCVTVRVCFGVCHNALCRSAVNSAPWAGIFRTSLTKAICASPCSSWCVPIMLWACMGLCVCVFVFVCPCTCVCPVCLYVCPHVCVYICACVLMRSVFACPCPHVACSCMPMCLVSGCAQAMFLDDPAYKAPPGSGISIQVCARNALWACHQLSVSRPNRPEIVLQYRTF